MFFVSRYQALLAAGAGIEQRFHLADMGGTQLLARQQGLHLLENTVGWHCWQDGRDGTRDDAWHAHGPSFHVRCWRAGSTTGQETQQQ
jgi:hypothetical protein